VFSFLLLSSCFHVPSGTSFIGCSLCIFPRPSVSRLVPWCVGALALRRPRIFLVPRLSTFGGSRLVLDGQLMAAHAACAQCTGGWRFLACRQMDCKQKRPANSITWHSHCMRVHLYEELTQHTTASVASSLRQEPGRGNMHSAVAVGSIELQRCRRDGPAWMHLHLISLAPSAARASCGALPSVGRHGSNLSRWWWGCQRVVLHQHNITSTASTWHASSNNARLFEAINALPPATTGVGPPRQCWHETVQPAAGDEWKWFVVCLHAWLSHLTNRLIRTAGAGCVA
jgi:hypothetical protein